MIFMCTWDADSAPMTPHHIICCTFFSVSRQLKLVNCTQQLEHHRREIAKLRTKERALVINFQTILGENTFKDFLTIVFNMKVKRVKKEEQTVSNGEK